MVPCISPSVGSSHVSVGGGCSGQVLGDCSSWSCNNPLETACRLPFWSCIGAGEGARHLTYRPMYGPLKDGIYDSYGEGDRHENQRADASNGHLTHVRFLEPSTDRLPYLDRFAALEIGFLCYPFAFCHQASFSPGEANFRSRLPPHQPHSPQSQHIYLSPEHLAFHTCLHSQQIHIASLLHRSLYTGRPRQQNGTIAA